MPPAKTPLVRGDKLTDRGREKLRGQITKAEAVMRSSMDGKRIKDGKKKTYAEAKRMRDRAQKALGAEVSPGKTQKKAKPAPGGSLSDGARAVAGLVGAGLKKHKKTQDELKKVQDTASQTSAGGRRPIREEDYNRTMRKD